jgi:ferrous iron transport protein B
METPQNAGSPMDANARPDVRKAVNPQSAIRNPQSGRVPGGTPALPNPQSAIRNPQFLVVLCGNPNSGKTTLFNALTGLRARVGNYAGVTVERKEGRLAGGPAGLPVTVLDLPGTYSLSPQSPDEQICRDVLLQRLADVPAPGMVIVVVDASNLERNLYFATQVIELGYPTLIALNMMDLAERNGQTIASGKLAAALGAAVIPTVASSGAGVPEIREKIAAAARGKETRASTEFLCDLPGPLAGEVEALAQLPALRQRPTSARAEALLIVSDEKFLAGSGAVYPAGVREAAAAARQRLEQAGVDWRSSAIEARYIRLAELQHSVVADPGANLDTVSDKLDRVVTHKFWGMLIFIAVMALMFLSIFTFAQWPMDMLSNLFTWVGDWVHKSMPGGDLESLLEKGVVLGVGAVVAFLPQICLLFLFIGLLEDTGYMARAAFLMDRLMSKVGLHGKSFIPMLSSFACAIPGIMATRTIETPKDRLVTILVAPLMSCSARLPVYTLLIGACIGGVWMKSLTMLSMYLLGIVVALGMAWIFKKTLLKGETPMLVMELPPYRRPVLKVVLRHTWDRAKLFLVRAGTVILGINILLWFLVSYPSHPEIRQQFATRRAALLESFGRTPHTLTPEEQAALDQLDADRDSALVQGSFAGQTGKLLEPAIAPLGFDWKMGIGILSSFAAREVFVSTMSIVYSAANHANENEEAHNQNLQKILAAQERPDGSKVYTPLTAITLMVFYVLALQCVSTVAVVRRETNSWKWPVFQWVYMGALAWVLAFVTFQGGHLLGLK